LRNVPGTHKCKKQRESNKNEDPFHGRKIWNIFQESQIKRTVKMDEKLMK
jgi:hypothetical protein